MLTTFAKVFRVRRLRRRFLLTLLALAVFRLGENLPVPGVNVRALKSATSAPTEVAQLHIAPDLFAGGAFRSLSVFTYGIYPVLFAGALLGVLTVFVPRLEALRAEGRAGAAKLAQYRRNLTVVIGLAQGASLVAAADGQHLLLRSGFFPCAVMVLCMGTGTTVVMWLAELITERGIGNGLSLLFFAQIVAGLAPEFWGIVRANGALVFVTVVATIPVFIAGMVFVDRGVRTVPLQQYRPTLGPRKYGSPTQYLPLKVNSLGSEPALNAGALLYLPVLAGQLWPDTKWIRHLQPYTRESNPWHMAAFFILIVFMTYFVTFAVSDEALADKLLRRSWFIPGIRPGRPTAEYLRYVRSRITAPAAVYLGLLALLPIVASTLLGVGKTFPLGTAILLALSAGLNSVDDGETVEIALGIGEAISSRLPERDYGDFLR